MKKRFKITFLIGLFSLMAFLTIPSITFAQEDPSQIKSQTGVSTTNEQELSSVKEYQNKLIDALKKSNPKNDDQVNSAELSFKIAILFSTKSAEK
ncbi:hypothetical protein NIE88_19405 [Sporolactobacillus shoreicorticis]|uniref:Uncharacterized protein n=1 Tax=Sporolactobacillus shoreicorticis TaxID=1923877 RepID=A0ABW5S1B5_9BACL|nr:hypothetical protein [Sporolactobacillus shoreicorticis]MCO7127910.1 hypothetical protein [Sporolactobacillus shoreicorticis]